MALTSNTEGKLSALPTKTTLRDELTNPVFIATQLLSVLSAVVFVLVLFHAGPAATGIATALRGDVTIIAPVIAVLAQAVYALHHLSIKKLEVALVAIEHNPQQLVTDVTNAKTFVEPLVEDVEQVAKSL